MESLDAAFRRRGTPVQWEVALSICDYAYLIKRGSIVAQGTVPEMRADAGVLDAYLA